MESREISQNPMAHTRSSMITDKQTMLEDILRPTGHGWEEVCLSRRCLEEERRKPSESSALELGPIEQGDLF